jgi:superfamily II DNA/RNA helicase
MPRTAASNGIRPEIRALAVFELNVPVTPKEINDCVGTGDYAAKYVSFLNTRYGFTITAQRNGRTVVSYTMVAEPKNVEELRNTKAKVKTKVEPKVKVAKTKAKPVTKTKTKAKVEPKAKVEVKAKESNLDKIKKAAEKLNKTKVKVSKPKEFKVDKTEETFGSSGAVGSIDAGWDSIDGVDIRSIV